MLDKLTRALLVIFLCLSIGVGGWLAYQKHGAEGGSRTVELVMDFRDLQMLSALSKVPLDKLLDEIKSRGIVSVGLLEETLPDAQALGEIVYAGGTGIERLKGLSPILDKLIIEKKIKPSATYILSLNSSARKRIKQQLQFILIKDEVKTLGENVIEVNEAEVRLREVGLGLSENVSGYLIKKGFRIVPRLWNDPRYDVRSKIGALKGYDTVIFDGDEITGFPDRLNLLSTAMKKTGIKYGWIEIIKQDGDQKLRALMKQDIVRVHSVPKDELLKISKDEALARFTKAVRERGVRLLYIRPFLPPQITEDPVTYNLDYLSKAGLPAGALAKAGYDYGKASTPGQLTPDGWQILVLGVGVLIVTILLIDLFFHIPWYLIWPALVGGLFGMLYVGAFSHGYPLEKGLALLAAIVFPSYGVISTYSKPRGQAPWLLVINSVMETAIGIFLIIGLLSNTDFLIGSQTFAGIKIALTFPVLIVALYFFLKPNQEPITIKGIKEKTLLFIGSRVPVLSILLGLTILGGLYVLVARSGNFTLPVPGFEKQARELLEVWFGVRPRTKEFLIGYPFLAIAGWCLLKNKTQFLWVLLAIGVIGPISLLNTFTHVHTPVVISITRSVSGLVLGIVIGSIITYLLDRFIKK
ncbi:hypothetical protein HZC35_01415 [Candidatus Saganbacteria bacterium]|nr:hypothetical protein [Candidatus Saganbacteria bacterium]